MTCKPVVLAALHMRLEASILLNSKEMLTAALKKDSGNNLLLELNTECQNLENKLTNYLVSIKNLSTFFESTDRAITLKDLALKKAALIALTGVGASLSLAAFCKVSVDASKVAVDFMKLVITSAIKLQHENNGIIPCFTRAVSRLLL